MHVLLISKYEHLAAEEFLDYLGDLGQRHGGLLRLYLFPKGHVNRVQELLKVSLLMLDSSPVWVKTCLLFLSC